MSHRPVSYVVGGVGGAIGLITGTAFVNSAITYFYNQSLCGFVMKRGPLGETTTDLTWECGIGNAPDATGWFVAGVAVVVFISFMILLGLANLVDDWIEKRTRS